MHPATVLDWMEQSPLGSWVATSTAGYYVMLAFHSTGLAMLVGSVFVADLRILGFARGISLPSLDRFVKIGIYGFLINALSGLAVFFSEANKAFYSTSFRWKMLLMALGMISTLVLRKTALRGAAAWADEEPPSHAKAQALLSMTLWTGTIIVGRMMAYLGDSKPPI